jgi:phosphoenolpyruvate carboxykinase (diphosphate)
MRSESGTTASQMQKVVSTSSGNGHSPAAASAAGDHGDLVDYIALRLAVAGHVRDADELRQRLSIPHEVIAQLKERIRLSHDRLSPICQRAQDFLNRYLAGVSVEIARLPGLGQCFTLDRTGMAEELSIPEGGDHFESDIVKSYKLVNSQGVLHNPKSDRRTTQGVFHVADGGLAIPDDKLQAPKETYARLLAAALNPPQSLETLPYTTGWKLPFHTLLSLTIRPLVCPEYPGLTVEKRSEIAFFAPGNLISNLDFIERIFGNAGDPHLPENDAGLDIAHWTGHTGIVILAPHLIALTKKEVGLPVFADATERQKADGMCWKSEDELYNGGQAFKITARDESGVMVTIIADNYFGYCKKEVKTQMSYCANLLGGVEEEHAGGAIVFPRYDLGTEFSVPTHLPHTDHTFAQVKDVFADAIDIRPEGYAVDRRYKDLIYVPENVHIDVDSQKVSWATETGVKQLPLSPLCTYIVPSGFKVRLEQEQDSAQWRLIGTFAEGTFCHKPSTVSGGGKSEISKPITDTVKYGPQFVADFEADMDAVQALLDHDYGNRFRDRTPEESRPILSPHRSVGSVIKLLTPSTRLYTDEYNAWLDTIPHSIRELVYIVKRFYRPEIGADWRSHFAVNAINGRPGNVLHFEDEPLLEHYVRVGFNPDGGWRMFSLRSDYYPAEKLQREDDITVSTVLPVRDLPGLNPRYKAGESVKIVSAQNPEKRLFQRPDDAIHRGQDRLTEAHFGRPGNFLSNYEPLTQEDAQKLIDAPIQFSQYTAPMQHVIEEAAKLPGYFVSSAHPRIFEGKPTKNPRYLQDRADLLDHKPEYVAEIGTRLYRKLTTALPLPLPVNAVLAGRRLNPPEKGIRSLAVYGPIHYQETPELFMELISSLTGKSPSTTGAGSEGALTKGPFNALLPILDINSAYCAHVLTGTECFVTAAGFVGPKFRVDHDISLLIPEIWSRMSVRERQPQYLIENNYIEKVPDVTHGGRVLESSRLGYRITDFFVSAFFGIVFDNPNDLFTEEMLRPEQQGMEEFADGIDNIIETQRTIAEHYFHDGSVELACPPLKALLHIMRHGSYEGRNLNEPVFRKLFTAKALVDSTWYRERLTAQKQVDKAIFTKHIEYLQRALASESYLTPEMRGPVQNSLAAAKASREHIDDSSYTESLHGRIGVTPGMRLFSVKK